MEFYAFEMSFPLPYQPPHWRVKPDNFLAHFVGHEGPGSLHAYLKNKGWITALSAGPQNLARGFAMIKITLNMTKLGFGMVLAFCQAGPKMTIPVYQRITEKSLSRSSSTSTCSVRPSSRHGTNER